MTEAHASCRYPTTTALLSKSYKAWLGAVHSYLDTTLLFQAVGLPKVTCGVSQLTRNSRSLFNIRPLRVVVVQLDRQPRNVHGLRSGRDTSSINKQSKEKRDMEASNLYGSVTGHVRLQCEQWLHDD